MGVTWTCEHSVPLGQYCPRCAAKRLRSRAAAAAFSTALRVLVALLPERHTECPDRACGGGAR